jgi:phosphoribosylformylglycinamidine synthase
MQNHKIYLHILESQYLIQSRIELNARMLSEIVSIIKIPQDYKLEKKTNYSVIKSQLLSVQDAWFYAPYTNYYTAFSTTVISLLERLDTITPGDIIRIEEIYFTPQDPLIYKYYTNLSNYKEYIIESQSNIDNEKVYFQAIRNHSHLLDTIKNISPILSLEGKSDCPLDNTSYFDLMSWIQCNSEHSRHWVFNTKLYPQNISLLKLIKSTLQDSEKTRTNSIIAFCDNSSAIQGVSIPLLSYTNSTSEILTYQKTHCIVHPTLTAETHNYPTYYHPFQGAATGVGGRIRDSLATGCGSISSASFSGYSINNQQLLKAASNGASDYANKIGEPCIGGFLRFHPMFEKPIMFSAGLGFLKNSHRYSPTIHTPEPGDLIVKVGPPAFKIGFGGSVMSSVDNTSTEGDMTAIQRGDPYNGNKIARFLEILALTSEPIIKKIHDQGAGGLANVITELLDGNDAVINLADLPAAYGMNSLECWISEYQEQMVFICSPKAISQLKSIASREGVLLHIIGTILPSKTSTIQFTLVSNQIYDYHYDSIGKYVATHYPNAFYSSQLQEIHHTTHKHTQTPTTNPITNPITQNDNIQNFFQKYHTHTNNQFVCQEAPLESAFKCHLTNKVDRSVGGSVVQQSCIGPYSLPLSNYAITRVSPLSPGGILSAIGENIYIGQLIGIWIDKTVCELLCNLIAVPNLCLSRIKLSGNWMLNAKSPECLQVLYYGVLHLTDRLKSLQLAIDGGKDSLTMSMKTSSLETINSPPTLVLTSYSLIQEVDIRTRISPLLNNTYYKTSKIYYIDFLNLLETDTNAFITEFALVQSLIASGHILAAHDGSTVMDILEEIAVASGIGLIITTSNLPSPQECIFNHHYLIIQIDEEPISKLSNNWHYIAILESSKAELSITYKETQEFQPLETIFHQRMKPSLELDTCTFPYKIEYKPYTYKWPTISESTISNILAPNNPIKIAIIRDEGSNSHREMAAAFLQFSNISVFDYTINQLLTSQHAQTTLLECRGVVFVGGFAYGDVLGSGRATAMIMRTRLSHLWEPIFQNSGKFVLGVCNGCQILVEYGLLGDKVAMARNKSGKFESRWLPVKYKTPLSNTNAQLGIWVAHGEGRFILTPGWQDTLEPLGTYITSHYPSNPNGSDSNIIGLKSKVANHYIIMPHPERSIFKWQCEWIPPSESSKYEGNYSPWLEFFHNLIQSITS